jgi:predicted nucleotidyltransferase
MPKHMEDLLRLYRDELRVLLNSHIKKVILYGSYARGDFNKESDIDIMILVDLNDIRNCEDQIINMTYDFNMEHGTDIIPVVQNIEHFEHWKNAYMFYNNINREGVAI